MSRYWVGRILFVLVALNVLNLSFYFLHSDAPRDAGLLPAPQNPVIEQRRSSFDRTKAGQFDGKPWPDLPSYMPWNSDPKLAAESCEAYFGNGFNRLFRVLDPLDDGRKIKAKAGRLSCAYSRTLRTSICQASRMVMHPDRIAMSKGGEDIDSVIGRKEGEELPSYSEGAFEIEAANHEIGDGRVVDPELLDRIMPQGAVQIHTMRSLLLSLRRVPSKDFVCSQWIEEPTLFVTRFEYANLFHTVTDWYSAYVTSRVSGLPNRPHLVFVDGHCKSPMDDAWEALFTSITYAKNFSGPVCFRHAIFTPLGYETALFKGLSDTITCYGCSVSELKHNPDDRRTARLIEFGEMFRAAFNLLSGEGQISRQSSGHNVLFVRREDYLAHPRHRGKVESRLTNEEEVLVALQKWAANHSKCKVSIVNGLFAHMSMMDQVRAVQAASVIVGAHGAALTHVIAAKRGTVVLEIMSSLYRRPHFALISQWTGLEYHVINMQALTANCSEVVEVLGGILDNLGC